MFGEIIVSHFYSTPHLPIYVGWYPTVEAPPPIIDRPSAFRPWCRMVAGCLTA